jgi:putative pyrroloquinoline-quinone-binding quinoprotein
MKRHQRACLWAFGLFLSCCLCFGQFDDAAQTLSDDPNDWPMYNHDPLGTRLNSAESALSTKAAHNLKYKWMYFTVGDVYATPVVVDNTVYAGDTSGLFYALTSAGQLVWQFKAQAAKYTDV